MPGYSDTREDKVTLSAAVQYTGSNWEKWHSNYKGNAYKKISITISSIVLRRGCLHWKDLSQLRFLLALAMVMCSPLHSHIDTGNPSQDLPDILG